MAAAVDTGNSPIRFSGISSPNTSAAFTAPANSVLVCCVEFDSVIDNSSAQTVSDSSGLTWHTNDANAPLRSGSETTTGGTSQISWAVAASSVSRTVTVTTVGLSSTGRISAKVYVVTGADTTGTPTDAVGVDNEGGSTTDSINTTSLTPGANGLLFVADCEWNARGVFDASSDLTQDTATYAGAISVNDGYKACTSGVGVTGNLNANNAGAPQHKWCQLIVRAAPSATRFFLLGRH